MAAVTQSANAGQIDFWNGHIGKAWASHRHDTARMLAEATQSLLNRAAIRDADKVLDIGCGAGESSVLAGHRVGTEGGVTGIDISAPLLARAKERAEKANVQFIQADAATYAFAPIYDAIISQFGVMFFDDPKSAFLNIRKAAAKGGRLTFLCFRAAVENAFATIPLAAVAPLLPAADPAAPGSFAFADPDRIREVLDHARFSRIEIDAYDGVMDLGPDPARAALQMINLGPTARMLLNADEVTRERALSAVTQSFEEGPRRNGSITPGIACWLVHARAD